MADLVEVPFKGRVILFATAGSKGPEAYAGTGVTAKAQETFDEVLQAVCTMGEVMAKKLSGLSIANAEASFGISFTGKGNFFFVAEASAQAAVTVKLTFKGN